MAAEMIQVVPLVDAQRTVAAVWAAENWDGHSVGLSGEVGPGQWLPSTWRMFSSRPVSWASSQSTAARIEQERVGLAEVKWILARLKGLGLEESAWSVGLVHNAGYGNVKAGLAEPRHRAFADRVQAIYGDTK